MLQLHQFYNTSSPVSFLSWLENNVKVSADFNENYKQYQIYIKDWLRINNGKKQADKSFFNSLYVDLLREISLNFLTEEERRFIVNFNYNEPNNLDIVIPFFIEKLKSICLFYSNKREKLKEKITLAPFRGTNFSIQRATKNIILDNIENNLAIKLTEGLVSFPSLSSITKNIDILVEEIYDDTDYFNKKPSPLSANFGNIDLNYKLYKDFKQAIIDAINQYPMFLKSLEEEFTINSAFSGSELNFLKERDFLNYFNNLSAGELRQNVLKLLFPKYASSSFYFLSVGDTITNLTSGLLFSTAPLTGSKISNLTNVDYSTIATVQNLDSLYTAYEAGKFFIPSNTGVLKYNTFKKTYEINYTKLLPNSVFVFPDPNIVEQEGDSPLIFKVDVSWNKQNLSTGFKFGEVISQSYLQRFYPYQSKSQDLNTQPHGLSLSVDNVDFWGEDRDSIWTDEQLWPGLDKVEKLPLDSRLDSLLFNAGTNVSWYTDMYGNEFGLYKKIEDNCPIYSKRNTIPGNLYIKNTVTGLVSSMDFFFKDIFYKYPETVKQQLKDSIFSIYLNKNIIVLETENYVVVESYDFDYVKGTFLINLIPGIYIPKHKINSNIEKYAGSYYVEELDSMYLCFISLLPELSSTNYKAIYPVIYKLDTSNINLFNQIYPYQNFDISYYSLSSENYENISEIDLKYVEGAKFSYKNKFNIFNLTYYAYNYNDIPFVINEQFSIENNDGRMLSNKPLLNKPYYYVHDTNFSNPKIDLTFRFGATNSELVGLKDSSHFKWNIEDKKHDNFHFSSKISPVFINIPGNHYVQFDWNQYPYGNIFIGCENLRVTYVDGVNYVVSDNVVNTITQDETWYKIRDYKFKNQTFTLSAFKPSNSNGSIIKFNISENQPTSGYFIFCNDLYSVYKNVKIIMKGDGFGIVNSDPFCVECVKSLSLSSYNLSAIACDFAYAKFSSITLTPSAYDGSVFAGWIGGGCDGTAGNCLLTVTDNTTLTAVFNKIPIYTLTLRANISGVGVGTLDGKIDCFNSVCSASYLDSTLVGVSAGLAPEGYEFLRFNGVEAGVNNPIGVTMSKNYSLTATYLSAVNSLKIYNAVNNNSKSWYLVGRDLNNANPTNRNFKMLTNTNNPLFYTSGLRSFGTIYCSLSPDALITGFAEFVSVRNKFITISATPFGNYVFKNYVGNPCQNSKNICAFLLSNNYSITGYFDLPSYTVSIFNSGAALFYTQSEDGNLNLGTFSLKNSRNKAFYSYLSGTVVQLSGVSTFGSGMRYISGGDYGAVSNKLLGDAVLSYKFPVTNNVTISSVCFDNTMKVSVFKEGNVNSVNSIVNIETTGSNPDQIIKTVELGVQQRVFLKDFPSNVNVEIYPSFIPPDTTFLYVCGFSGINLQLVAQTPVSIDTPIIYENDTVYSSDLITIKDGPAPIYVDKNDHLLNMTNVRYNNVLVSPLSAHVVFEELIP